MEGLSMLILERRVGEKIQIGDEIVVTVARLEGSRVRLGVEAPRRHVVSRKEARPRRAGDAVVRPDRPADAPGGTP
jgi:carbon storage regulator